jgi:transposase
MESTPAADRFVGIDVSKSWVDVHVRPDGTAFRCTTDGEGLAELVRRVRPLAPRLIVLEASGGYESIVAVSLAEAGLPVAIVNPRQTRKFAEALGLAGVAPFSRDSGRKKGKRFIRAGRVQVRAPVYMAGLVAIRFNPPLKSFYRRLREAGKPPRLALVAVMRKLLTILNAILRDNKPWASAES